MNQNFDIASFYELIDRVYTASLNVDSVLGQYRDRAKEVQDCIGPVDGGKIYEQWVNIEATTSAILEKYKERRELFLKHFQSYVDSVLAANLSYYTELQSSSENLNNINNKLGSL